MNQRRLSVRRAQRLNRHVIDCMLTLSFKPEHHGEKKRDDETLGERRFEGAREQRASCPGRDRHQQPGKAITKSPPERSAADLREMKTNRFKNRPRSAAAEEAYLFALVRLQDFLGNRLTSTTPTTRFFSSTTGKAKNS